MLDLCVHLARTILNGLLTILGVMAYHLGLARFLTWLNRRAPKVLMYHACEPVESDFMRGLAINTTPQQFASHLGFLVRHYRVVPLADLTRQANPEPSVAITFDDGFHSVHECAWPLLAERGLAATCYLVTDVIDNNALIWLNEINWYLHHHGPIARQIVSEQLGLKRSRPIGVLVHALRERFDPAVTRKLLASLRAATGTDSQLLAQDHRMHLTRGEIAEMAAAGMTFGNHTGSHPPLARVTVEECRAEIRRAADFLAQLPGACATLAYPFGSRSESTRRVALELGIQSLLEVEGVNNPLDPMRIGRIKVGAFSPAVLFARMEVVEPVKSTLKKWLRGRPR